MHNSLLNQIQLDPTRRGGTTDSFEKSLGRLIIGQSDAVQQIVNIYQMYLTGMNPPGRPIGNFLFLGPTGTGKTRAVEATAETLFSNPQAVIKIDCSEFQHAHEIAKLVGSPPGYLGHRETHPMLSQEVISQYYTDKCKISLILFDEIEKASDAVWNLLLGVLDKGTLSLGDNRKVNFSKAMIFMTSNVGATEMSNILSPSVGFGLARLTGGDVTLDAATTVKIKKSADQALRKKFTPEFINRLDKIVVFQPLGETELRKVLDIELSQVQQRIFAASAERSFVFRLSPAAKEYILQQGVDPQYGARHLKRSIERLLVQPLSNLIATCQARPGNVIYVDCLFGNNLTFHLIEEGLSPAAMVEYDSLSKPVSQPASATAAVGRGIGPFFRS